MSRKRAPDWAKLRAIGAELEALQAAGKWDRAAFDRILRKAQRACHGHGEFTEFVINEYDFEWPGQHPRWAQSIIDASK